MRPEIEANLAAGGTVLASHPRLARALAADADRQQRDAGLEAWPRPRIFTLDAWLEQAWTARGAGLLLSSAQEQRLWESVLKNAPGNTPGVDLAAEAAAAWQLAQAWELDWSSPAWRDSEETEAFAGWAAAFRRECRAHQWITAAELPAAAAAPPPGPVLLVGFDESTPAQARLFAAWRAGGCEVASSPSSGPAPAPQVRTAADAAAELALAAAWARDLLHRGAAGPIGVVVPGLGSVRVLAERIFAYALHPDREPWSTRPRAYHVSLGPALAFAGPAHAMLSLLRAVESAAGATLAEVLPWLRSPYFADSDSERGARAQLERALRHQHRQVWGWTDLRNLARGAGCSHWAAALDGVRTARGSWPARQSHSAWADSVARLGRAAGWPGERGLSSEEHQAGQAWEALLLDFAKLDEVAPPPIGFPEARSRLQALAQRVFQPQAADAPVQILGWPEAAGAEFRHLWIAGLSDDAVPPAGTPHPFLPLALQRGAGMPRASAELAAEHARREWQRLLASAPQVVASWAATRAEEALRPSPLLAGAAAAQVSGAAPSLLTPAPTELCEDALAPAAEGEEIRGPARILEDQSACAFRAFAHHRLHAGAAEPVADGLPATLRGELLHALLAVAWSQLRTQDALLAAPAAALASRAAEWAKAIVDNTEPLRGAPGLAALEAQRLARTALDWLDEERERGPFEVVAREEDAELQFAGLHLRMRRDRLDRAPNGDLHLLDYKSGPIRTAAPWQNGVAEFPQLPLYAVTHPQREKIAAIAFARVRTGEMKLISQPTPLGTLEAWEAELAALARAYLAGEARVAPREPPKTCEHCDLGPLCRIREQEAGDGD